MLAAWMVYATAISLLAGATAVALDQVLGLWRVPRRGIWIAAMLVACVLPVTLATRRPVRGAARGPTSARPSTVARAATATARARSTPWQITVFRWSLRVDSRVRLAWKLASAVTATVFVTMIVSVQRRRRAWRPTTLDGESVWLSTDVGPAVVGFIRPGIVIPEWALSLGARERRLMLAHEREHLDARDPWLLLLAGIALTLFPWNLALWWMTRRLRLAIEIDCDGRVVPDADAADEYGLFLIAVGERRNHGLFLAASLAERRSSLERRIYAMTMLRPRHPIFASLPFIAIAAGAATLAAQTPTPPGGVAPAGAIVARPSAPPADRIHLTNDQVRLIIAAKHPGVATGSSEDNTVTIVLASNGDYVVSGSSKTPVLTQGGGGGGFVATATVAPKAEPQMGGANQAAVVNLRESSAPAPTGPRMMNFAGVGDIDASLVKDFYSTSYAAGDVSQNAIRVRFVTLVGNAVK